MGIVPLPNRKSCRRGSALLMCTLAIAVLSMASIAILRGNQRGVVTVGGVRATRQARHTADGMVQRAIAAIRLNPTISGQLPLPRSAMPGARVELIPISGTATQIQVYLYARAVTPARDLIVDPAALAGTVKPPVIPVKPIAPTKPISPVKPTTPVKRIAPVKPSKGSNPVKVIGISRR